MRVCPNCGYVDPHNWRHSRYDYNADYCRFDDPPKGLEDVISFLKDKDNFVPYRKDPYIYYRRGTGGIWLYRVWKYDFKMPRERKKH